MKNLTALLAALILIQGVYAGEENSDAVTRVGANSSTPRIPPLLKLGDTGDRVLELQATLNAKLRPDDGAATFPLSQSEQSLFKIDIVENTESPTLKADFDGETLILNLSKRKWTVDHDRKSLTLNAGQQPLKVDGIYGPQTFVAVLLFQQKQSLNPTGEVDAVTLDRLEPLVPPNFMLAKLMETPSTLYNDEADTYAWWVKQTTSMMMFLILVAVCFVVHLVARTLAHSTEFLSHWVFTPTSSPWFSTLKDKKFFARMAHFAPAVFLCLAASTYPAPGGSGKDPFPYIDTFESWHIFVWRLGLAYVALVFARVTMAYLDACHEIFTAERPKDNPIEGIIGAARRIVAVIGIVLICAALAGRNPGFFVGGLGAVMAIIMLVFKDAILGLVASVQIVAHNMVKIGDWIEMAKYGVDGDVISISLTTIKIRNFDKTISSIPTYAVLSESFKNWRGMQEAGGRRIKRWIFLDMNSIKPLNYKMTEHLGKISLLKEYIDQKRSELQDYFLSHDVLLSPANGRWLTNVGTFRIYLQNYLRQHPDLNTELTCLVRQLQPTREGLPLEIYVFTKNTDWGAYEQVQADIFDHVISILPEFELRLFQDPSEFNYEHASDLFSHRIDHQATLGLFGDIKGDELNALSSLVEEQNSYLIDHPRARVETAAGKIDKEIEQSGLTHKVRAVIEDRTIVLRQI